MSSRSEFEEFARDCVRLAGQANSPELRQKLLISPASGCGRDGLGGCAENYAPVTRIRGKREGEVVRICPRAFEAEQVTIRISVHAKSQNQDHHYWHARAVKVARGRSRKSRLAHAQSRALTTRQPQTASSDAEAVTGPRADRSCAH
jgi:hypothetical protein